MTIETIMNYLLENSAPNLRPDALAEIFDRLIWCLNDNGTELLKTRDNWLATDDYNKVSIALCMKETFPYNNKEDMITNFNRIKKHWPSLSEQCDEIIREWNTQFPNR